MLCLGGFELYSRWVPLKGVVQMGSYFDSIFLLFLMKLAGAHAQSSRGKSPAITS